MKTLLNKILSITQPSKSDVTNAFEYYQNTRNKRSRKHLCNAPFNSLYFNVSGQGAPCWLTLDAQDNYPNKTIKEIWNSQKINSIRTAIENKDLEKHCNTCLQNIKNGNHTTVLSKLYDYEYQITDYPSVMEFELSNTCNLECVMCKGELSSTIRKHREQLPPINIPYDTEFVSQLVEFIPHLKEAKFLGGEPFLIDIYFDIWEKMIEINPKIKITITTNGAIYNERVKRVLEHLKCNIILSLDSVREETYQTIRLRGNFNKVILNLSYFLEYTKKYHTYMGISANPMKVNWIEIPEIVEFCNKKQVQLWLNTIIYPHAHAMWTMSSVDLEKAYKFLSEYTFNLDKNDSLISSNILHYQNFVQNQVQVWMKNAIENESQSREFVKNHSEEDINIAMKISLLEYVDNDAYLTSFRKEELKSLLLKNLDKVFLSSQSSITELYSMPQSNCYDFLINYKI